MNCRFRVNAYFLSIVILMLQVFAFGQGKAALPWTIDPDGLSGQFTKVTTEADLKRMFGERNVQDRDIYLGEGNSEKGTALFPEEPQKFIAIIWNDAQGKRFPKTIFVGGIDKGSYALKSLWKTSYGISLGTTLKDLEKINRRPFRLAGFNWDYGGTVLSWAGGFLEKDFGSKENKKAFVRLSADQAHLADTNLVQGDRDFSSGHPAMQTINPSIFQIVFTFGQN